MTEAQQSPGPADVAALSPDVKQKSTFGVLVDVFTAPTRAFEAFNAQPRVLLAIILLVVISAATGYLTAPYSAQLNAEILSQSSTLPPEYLEQTRQNAENPSLLQPVIGAPVVIIIVTLVEALVALFLGKLIFGGDAKFKTVWGVGLLSALIVAVGGLLRVPLIMAKDSMFVSIGPAALLPNKTFTSLAYLFFYYLDLFAIWAIIVAGIGYAVVFGFTRGKGYTVSVIVSVLMILIGMTFQYVGMAFAGVKTTLF
jgi:hypothetical protein